MTTYTVKLECTVTADSEEQAIRYAIEDANQYDMWEIESDDDDELDDSDSAAETPAPEQGADGIGLPPSGAADAS